MTTAQTQPLVGNGIGWGMTDAIRAIQAAPIPPLVVGGTVGPPSTFHGIANVSPIFKMGDLTELASNRYVSQVEAMIDDLTCELSDRGVTIPAAVRQIWQGLLTDSCHSAAQEILDDVWEWYERRRQRTSSTSRSAECRELLRTAYRLECLDPPGAIDDIERDEQVADATDLVRQTREDMRLAEARLAAAAADYRTAIRHAHAALGGSARATARHLGVTETVVRKAHTKDAQ